MVVWIQVGIKTGIFTNSGFHVGSILGYIVSTCETLSKRMEGHKADYQIYVDGNKHRTTALKKNEHGQEPCKIELKNF